MRIAIDIYAPATKITYRDMHGRLQETVDKVPDVDTNSKQQETVEKVADLDTKGEPLKIGKKFTDGTSWGKSKISHSKVHILTCLSISDYRRRYSVSVVCECSDRTRGHQGPNRQDGQTTSPHWTSRSPLYCSFPAKSSERNGRPLNLVKLRGSYIENCSGCLLPNYLYCLLLFQPIQLQFPRHAS
jgi:hypothetical protein